MNVHQMSVTYVSEQDRILLRINTTEGEEMRLWLTRRLMLGLWPGLNQTILGGSSQPQVNAPVADDAARKMVAEFQRQAFLQKSDFATPYTVEDAALPLGPEPLLVSQVQVTPLSRGTDAQQPQLRIHFQEKPGTGAPQRGFQLELAPQLSHGLLHLLERALRESQWGLAGIGAAPAAEPEATAAAGDERPKYLN
ncbi:MAG: hypothetical protein JWP29_1434 [Rhodoferax sp.]|nr:hypothetical protein [Rhodoferax sp.]